MDHLALPPTQHPRATMTPTHDNRPRQRPERPAVESWFLRANLPGQARALWLKITTLGHPAEAGVTEAWCSLFDGDDTAAWRTTVPWPSASISGGDGTPVALRAAGCEWHLDDHGGSSRGRLTGDAGTVAWDLRFSRVDGPLGEPLCLLPSRRLVDGPLPRSKLLTPFPATRVHGTLHWNDTPWEITDWIGMQGHNWQDAHAPEYAWGHCVFTTPDGALTGLAEGATGRIRIAGVTTPRISLLGVRHDGRTYRFDTLVDLWRQDGDIAFPNWTLRIRGADGEALLAMRANPTRMVCLGYDNPDRSRRFCHNSKTAAVTLRVQPVRGHGFELASTDGGALEFLLPDAHVLPVV
ncbi:MAG: hypothetical protein EA398_06415 [Deltaproteobacteria bacterium]|nr:MAG: hypothetical protein EA398_06415 [Deltaproteobacteria bacterium]